MPLFLSVAFSCLLLPAIEIQEMFEYKNEAKVENEAVLGTKWEAECFGLVPSLCVSVI